MNNPDGNITSFLAVKLTVKSVNKTAVLLVSAATLVVSMIDITAFNVALPQMQAQLQASTGQLQWIVDIYMLVLAAFLLLMGSLGDRFGHKKALIAGIAVFAVGSIVGGLATGPLLVILGRGIQAFGGALMPPVSLAIINDVYTDKAERARAVGVWGSLMGIGMALGPLLGGFMVQYWSWRAVFWVNVPLAVVLIAVAARVVPEINPPKRTPFDWVGQLLAIATLGLLTFTIINAGETGWQRWHIAPIVAVLLGLAAFIATELHVSHPMVEMRFLKSLPFSLTILDTSIGFFAYAGFLFIFSLYLQQERGLAPSTAGLMMVPLAVLTSIFAAVSGRIVAAHGNRIPLLMYAIFLIVGALMAMQLGPSSSLLLPIAVAMIFGAAMGSINASASTAALAGMPREKAGVAGALLSTGRQTGQSLGVAVIGSGLNQGLQDGLSISQAASSSWWLVIAIGVVCGVLAIVATGELAKRSQERIGSW